MEVLEFIVRRWSAAATAAATTIGTLQMLLVLVLLLLLLLTITIIGQHIGIATIGYVLLLRTTSGEITIQIALLIIIMSRISTVMIFAVQVVAAI